MRKSTTHLKHVSRFLSTTIVDVSSSGKSTSHCDIPTTTCRRNSHLIALLNTFTIEPLIATKRHFIPHRHSKKSIMSKSHRSMSTHSQLAISSGSSQANRTATILTPRNSQHVCANNSNPHLSGSLHIFNLADSVTLANLDHAIRSRNADKAWMLFTTLTSRSDEPIPLQTCCSLYFVLQFAKKVLAGGSNKFIELRQRQLDQVLDYIQRHISATETPELLLSSIQEIQVPIYKQLQREIVLGNRYNAWMLFFKFHQKSTKRTMGQYKLPRNTCLKLMLMMMEDKGLDENQLKIKLQLIALHGAGTSEFDSRYLSASDLYRLAYIYNRYKKEDRIVAHNLIDEYVQGIVKKKLSIRADALDELIWRILTHGDVEKARQVLNTVQSTLSDKIGINEMVFVNIMNAYRLQKNYHAALQLFEQLLESNAQPSIKGFNAVLQIFAAQGSADRASYIFESMIQLGIAPDTATFTEMIRANAKGGHIKTCTFIYNKMTQQYHLQPNVYTFSALIKASSRRNDIRSVLRWFQIMLNENVEPNTIIISCILKSLSKQHGEYPNMPEAVLSIANQASLAGIKTDAALYTILLKMQAESIGIEGALKTHRDMLAHSIESNAYVYTILIDTCGKNRMPETAEKIFELMKKSKRHKPNTVTYSALMDAWLKVERKDKVGSLVLEFLQECKSDKTGRFWLDSRIQNRLKSASCC